MDYVNDYEIIVCGLKRSGHHGFMNWLRPHFNNVLFLNDIEPNTNPYLQAKFGAAHEGHVVCPRRKSCVMYSFEDRWLSNVFSAEYLRKREAFVGHSRNKHNIVVVRDLPNFVASRIRQKEPWVAAIIPHIDHPVGAEIIAAMWRSYAMEALGETNVVPNKVVVHFDRWHADECYRRAVAGVLNRPFTDSGKETVSAVGKSSFDGTTFNGRASQMSVLERYKAVLGNATYERFASDVELIRLSERLRAAPIVHAAGC